MTPMTPMTTTSSVLSFPTPPAVPTAGIDPNGSQPQAFLPVMVRDEPTADDKARAEAMALAWKAYNGKLDNPFKNTRRADDNTKSNRMEPVVTTGVAFLFGDDLDFSLASADQDDTAPDSGIVATGQTSAEDFLDRFWHAANKITKLQKYAINGAVFGHPFFKLVPSGDVTKPPRLVVLNPQYVRLETDPDDCDTVLAYVIQYTVEDRQRPGMAIEKRQVIERESADAPGWRITDQVRNAATGSRPGTWKTVAQEEWAYADFSPIFDNQNLPNPNEAWGTPDITPDLIEANNAVNRAQSNMAKLLRLFAHPWRYTKNMEGIVLDVDPEKVQGLPPSAEVGQLEMAGNMESSLKFLATLRDNIDEQSRVPAVAVGRQEALPKGNLSGVALELLFQPLMQKTNQKRPLYGEMLERLCGAVLVLGGFQQRVGDIDITIQWPAVLPKDPQAMWTVAQMKQQVGVSKQTLLEEGGYDWDEEQQRTAEEGQAQMQSFTQGKGVRPGSQLPLNGNALPDGTTADPSQAQPQAAPNGQQPPVNHPAAIAQRAKMQALAGQ